MTLIELVIVILIFGIMFAIAVPRFFSLKEDSERGRCAANRSAVNSALVSTYGVLVARDPIRYQDWLLTITFEAVHDSMFASGNIPICPSGGEYSVNRGLVSCSIHGE